MPPRPAGGWVCQPARGAPKPEARAASPPPGAGEARRQPALRKRADMPIGYSCDCSKLGAFRCNLTPREAARSILSGPVWGAVQHP
jgi:hypothetical protein